MIREFRKEDLKMFEPNEYSALPTSYIEKLDEDKWWMYALERDSDIKAIVCFAEEDSNTWAVFVLLSKRFKEVKELKEFFDRVIGVLCPNRLWTATKKEASHLSERWHRLFGFDIECEREQDGVMYNIWSRVWESKPLYS